MKKLLFFLLSIFMLANITGFAQTLNEGFEGTSFPPEGWTSIHVSGDFFWEQSTYVQHSGNASAYWPSGYVRMTNNWLITPRLTPLEGESLSFYTKSRTYSNGTNVYVKVSTTGTDPSSFSTLRDITSEITDNWSNIQIDLSDYVGQNIYIGFYVENQGKDIYIDDVTGVSLSAITCPKPTNLLASNLTATSADITWTPAGSATSWQYVCVTTSAAPPDWRTAVTVTSPSASISGLSPTTNYDVYVRSYCSAEDQSGTMKVSFKHCVLHQSISPLLRISVPFPVTCQIAGIIQKVHQQKAIDGNLTSMVMSNMD